MTQTLTQEQKISEEEPGRLWGHVGLLLHGVEHTKWYPITRKTANHIARYASNYDTDLMQIQTLNNRYLLVNPMMVRRITILDDNASAPEDWVLGIDSYQGFSPEFYEALDGYADDDEEFPPELLEAVKTFVDHHQLDDNAIYGLTAKTFVYDSEGLVGDEWIEPEDLANLFLEIDSDCPTVLTFASDSCGSSGFYPSNTIALIDIPLLQFNKGFAMIREEEKAYT